MKPLGFAFSSIEYFNYFHIHAQEVSLVRRSSTISNEREHDEIERWAIPRTGRPVDASSENSSYDSLLASNFATNIDKVRVRRRVGITLV